jgi:hypothetical protein
MLLFVLFLQTLQAATITVCVAGSPTCTVGTVQAAIDAAVGGDIIEVTAGETFTENVTLKNHSGAPIIIRSSRWKELPAPGYRVFPSHSTLMPRIVGSIYATNPYVGISTADAGTDVITLSSAHGASVGTLVWWWQYPGGGFGTIPGGLTEGVVYCVIDVPSAATLKVSTACGGSAVDITSAGNAGDRRMYRNAPPNNWAIRGIEITTPDGTQLSALISIGEYEPAQQYMPHHIAIRHSYVHGRNNQQSLSRCILANATYISVTDSYMTDCNAFGQDTQAVGCWSCPGPLFVKNNYLAAAGENVLIGGSGTAYDDLDNGENGGMQFIGNHLEKPWLWKYSQGTDALPAGSCKYDSNGGEFYTQIVAVSSADPSTDVVTTTATHGLNVNDPIRITGGYSWGSLNVHGTLVYYVKTVPTTTTLTLSATQGGSTLDITSNISDPSTWIAKAVATCQGGTWTSANILTTWQLRYTFKNSFELKNAVNVLLRGNVFDKSWNDAQEGGVSIAQVDFFDPWSTVRYVTYDSNMAVNLSGGFSFASDGNGPPFANKVSYITFTNNLWHSTNGNFKAGEISSSFFSVLDHNTFVLGESGTSNRYAYNMNKSGSVVSDRITLSNNVFAGVGGVTSQDGFGCSAVPNFVTNFSLANNMFWGTPQGDHGWPSQYGACASGNIWTNVASAVPADVFTNPSAGDYSLKVGSSGIGAATDSTDIGINYPRLADATSGAIAGTPTWSEQANLRISSITSTAAVLAYAAPTSSTCTAILSTAPTYSPLHADTDTGGEQSDDRSGNITDGLQRQFVFGGSSALSASTRYWYKLTCGTRVMVGQFQTLPTGSGTLYTTIRLGSQAHPKALVQYGTTASLGTETAQVDCSTGCSVTFPATAGQITYWRHAIADAGGTVQATGAIKVLAP